jgi:predicted aldo/keto reductase-like oxidoreductase
LKRPHGRKGQSSANDPVTISPAGSYVPIMTPVVETALAWLLHKPGVTAPVVGAIKRAHLEDALAAAELRR